MKTALMIFAAIGAAFFDIATVVITFYWICGAINIGENQGTALIFMWLVGGLTTSAIAIGASEEE